jgi:ATP/maltotriose-dependent transcriptional regulator MalT/DNA-binding SARP family transcriptional activator
VLVGTRRSGPDTKRARRAQLLARIEAAPITTVEAAGGAGKSTLMIELGRTTDRHVVHVACTESDASADVFATTVLQAVDRSGLQVVEATGSDFVHAALAAFAACPTGVLIGIDDTHHLGDDAAARIVQLAERLRPTDGVVVLARRLPPVLAERMRTALHVDDSDLAFDLETVNDVCAAYGLRIGAAAMTRLLNATGGWAAAATLAIARLARTHDPETELTRLLAHPDVFRPLVDAALAVLSGPARQATINFAHVRFGSAEIVAALGYPELLDELRTAGLPVDPVPGAWFALPGPVRDLVAERAPPDLDRMRAAAAAFDRIGETLIGANLLIEVRLADDAAALISHQTGHTFGPGDHAVLDAIVTKMPEATLARHPEVLLHLARTANLAGRIHRRVEALHQARSMLHEPGRAELMRAVEAELLREQVREGDYTGGRDRAAALLAQCSRSEVATRAALLHALGSATVRLGEVRTAERYLSEAIELYRELGDEAGLADALIGLGYTVHCFAGEYDLSVARLNEALALDTLPLGLRAAGLGLLAEALEAAGRLDQADTIAREAADCAERAGDHRLAAYAYWESARIAAARGKRDEVDRSLRAVEANRSDWFDQFVGAQFLADAAELLCRVGDRVTALGYLHRAQAHPCSARSLCVLAEASIEARLGDPGRALDLLDETQAIAEPARRVALLITMLRGYAALRAGDRRAGAFSAEAFDHAAVLGNPELPYTIDPSVAAALVGLAAESGSSAAGHVWALGHRVRIEVLGQCAVTVGGRRAKLATGMATQLVGCIAAARGRITLDAVLDALWPAEPPDRSRVFLRKLLSKCNSVIGEDLLVRDGEMLTFVEGAEIDAVEFERDARVALATGGDATLGAGARARTALSRYRGDLLPDERYSEWAIVPRERLRQRRRALLELLVRDAEQRHDLVSALDWIEELIQADPDDEQHYLTAARLLVDAGQFGRARGYLQRADLALATLDLVRSVEHEALRQACGLV